MKSRVITAIVGIPIVLLVFFFYNTIALNIAVSLISIVAVYEILHNTKYVKNLGVLIISIIFAGIVAFAHIGILKQLFKFIILLYMIFLLSILFAKHTVLKVQEILIAFTLSLLIPLSFASIVFIREIQPQIAIHSIVMIFLCAWISDTGAYFAGILCGKHKLAPIISPKKTIEGAIGGVLFCAIINVAFTYIYVSIMSKQGLQLEVQLVPLLLITVVGSVVGILGDLSTSIIKRQCQIKDFGYIFPGHGGILDRFDSVLFIAPFLYIVLQVFPVIKVM